MGVGLDGGGDEVGNNRLDRGAHRLKLALAFTTSVVVATLLSIVNRELKLESLPPSVVVQRKTGVTTSNMSATFPTVPVIVSNPPPQGRNATTTSNMSATLPMGPVIVSNPVQQQRLNATMESAETADASFSVTTGIADLMQKQSQTTNETTTTSSSCGNVTTSIYLAGELGNNLHKIAHAKIIQFIAEEKGITSKLDFKMRSQGLAKSRRAAKDVHQCFPSLRSYDMAECNNVAFDESIRRQEESLGANQSMLKVGVGGDCEYDCIHDKLQFLDRLQTEHSCDDGWVMSGCKLNGTDCARYPLPILVANQFALKSLVDRFYDKIMDFFAFDEGACCKERPFPDETVYHFRGFGHEMPRVGRRGIFRELSPNQTANELFADLGPGDKLAIVSRFDDKATKPFVEALTRKGVIVRVIQKQTGVEDFCFMYSAQKELVGTASSTFLIWAGYLSKSVKKVRMYIVEDKKDDLGNGVYNYTHPVLKGRMHFQPILFEKYDYKNVF